MQSISAILSLCNIISSINFSILTDYKLFTLDYKSCRLQLIKNHALAKEYFQPKLARWSKNVSVSSYTNHY